jgi:hypothetical protein
MVSERQMKTQNHTLKVAAIESVYEAEPGCLYILENPLQLKLRLFDLPKTFKEFELTIGCNTISGKSQHTTYQISPDFSEYLLDIKPNCVSIFLDFLPIYFDLKFQLVEAIGDAEEQNLEGIIM